VGVEQRGPSAYSGVLVFTPEAKVIDASGS
jgi:hypothetical protein